MKNSKIRNALKDANIKQWELAEMLGIAETTLCVKLRRELPDREQEQIMKLIYEKGGAKNDENNQTMSGTDRIALFGYQKTLFTKQDKIFQVGN